MTPELEKKMIEDLGKSGFGSEMKAIRTFLSQAWYCTGFANYYDLDEEETREIDLIAGTIEHERLPGRKNLWVAFYIVAEVKKSEKPWIVFKEQSNIGSRDSWII